MFGFKRWAAALGSWWGRKTAPPQPAPQIFNRSQALQPRPVAAGLVPVAEGGPGVDDIMKKRIKELGEAINQSLTSSDPIAEAIGRIKAEGYEVFLVLEATVGVTRNGAKQEAEEEDSASAVTASRTRNGEPKFTVTPQDMKFLKSMRIGFEE